MSLQNDLREALGLEPDDDSRDVEIAAMQPADRMRLLCQWHLGDPTWAETFKEWMEFSGYVVEEKEAATTQAPEAEEQ